MNSVILCEGADDAYILGSYFQKKLNFKRDNDERFSEGFDFEPSLKNKSVNLYLKNANVVAIQSVGGKTKFKEPLAFLRDRITESPKNGLSQIFIMLDKDNDTDKVKLEEISNHFSTIFPQSDLISYEENGTAVTYQHKVRSRMYPFICVPVVIPFDEEGALETISMSAIKDETEEGAFVVQEANGYIDNLLKSGKLTSLLNKERERLKARFSATLSVTNPEHSTSIYTSLLSSNDWELSPVVSENFKVLTIFSPKFTNQKRTTHKQV